MEDILIFNIQTVIKIHNALPVSSATTVERGFRAMNRILSYARNSLTTQLASDFIRISLKFLMRIFFMELDLDVVVDALGETAI